jgi:FkbM family methyltransferase
MNEALNYKLRGLSYWLECLNPLRKTILVRDLPLALRLETYKSDAVGRGLYKRGVHEPALTQFVLDTFANATDCNFIDVGANIGYFSCILSKLAGPSGKVFAFEPEPQNFRLLERNIKGNQLTNVEAHSCAIGAMEGTARLGLYKPANRGRHSLVDAEGKSSIEVPVRRLDDVARESAPGAQSWSLVKIDVEGYEGYVLDGAAEILARTEILVIEYSPEYLKKSGVAPETIFEKLSPQFSRIFHIQEARLVEVNAAECLKNATQMDLIFRR